MIRFLNIVCFSEEDRVDCSDNCKTVDKKRGLHNIELINRLLQSEAACEDVMDPLLLAGIDRSHREQLERNPEAIFDILTMNSLKGRPSNTSKNHQVSHDGFPQTEADYEAFVREFPIDDSISECFAFAADTQNTSSLPRFITGAKRPQISKYSKLKKKLGWGTSEENLSMADDSVSRDTKRSKKGGGVQSKRHKWRTPKEKTVNFSDLTEFDTIGDFSRSDASHMDESHDQIYSNLAYSGSGSESSGHSHSTLSDHMTDHMTGVDDNFESQSMNSQTAVYLGPSVPPVPPKVVSQRVTDYVNVDSVRKEDCFSSILVSDQVRLMKNLETITSDVAMETLDHRGNTLLHRCVEMGSSNGVYMVLDRFPSLSSDMNDENMTAIELAVKLGQVSCLKVLLDRNKRNKALGTPLLNRLLNISGSNGQSDCLKLLLSYMPTDQHSTCTLPGDARGNTAAHVSAKNGCLQCLQTLVTSGCDVTSENLIHQRPLQVAHQNSRHDCFEYLLLLDVCEKLLNQCVVQASVGTVLRQQSSGVRVSIEQLKSYLQRYQQLFEETRQSLEENRENVLETLVNIHEDLIQVTEHAGNDNTEQQNQIRDKLDELAGEIERLEDTFEFSPLDDLDNILSRVMQALEDSLSDIATQEACTPTTLPEEQIRASLSKLMREVHADAIAENWNAANKVENIVSEVIKADSHTYEFGLRETNIQNPDNKDPRPSVRKHIVPVIPDVSESAPSHDERQTIGHSQSLTNSNLSRETDNPSSNIANVIDKKVNILERNSDTKPKWADLGKTRKTNGSDENEERSKTEKSVSKKTDSNAKKVKRKSSDKSVADDMSPGVVELENTKDLPNKESELRLLSLDERMDILIAGERARERLEDADYSDNATVGGYKPIDSAGKYDSALSPVVANSVCTSTTFTSITSDSSDFSPEPHIDFSSRKKKSGKFSFTSSSTDGVTHNNLVPMNMDSTDSVTSIDLLTLTSDSTSYWWDVEDEDNHVEYSPDHQKTPAYLDQGEQVYSDDLRNIQEENVSNDELRRRRVLQHIRALQRTRFPSSEFAEKITTSTGETIGGFETTTSSNTHGDIGRTDRSDKRIIVDVDSALRAREGLKPVPMPRSRKRVPSFNSDTSDHKQHVSGNDVYTNFELPRDQDVSSLDVQWEDMFMSDDDVTVDGKPWYEMSDDDVSLVPSWRSEDDTEGSRTPQVI